MPPSPLFPDPTDTTIPLLYETAFKSLPPNGAREARRVANGAPAQEPYSTPHSTPAALPPRRKFRRWLIASLVGADVLVLGAAVGLSYLARLLATHLGEPENLSESLASASVFIALGWLVSLALFGGYSTRLLISGPETYQGVVWASLAAAGFLGTVLYLDRIDLSRLFFLVLFPTGAIALLTVRYVTRKVVHAKHAHGKHRHSAVIIGRIEDIRPVVRTLRRESWLGYEVVGAIVTDAPTRRWELDGIADLGPIEGLARTVETVAPSALLFTAAATANAEEFRRIAWSLEHLRLDIVVVPAVNEIARDRVRMSLNAGLPFVHLDPPRAFETLRLTKRAVDVIGSALALALLSPLLAVVAATIRIVDGAPVLFRQERVGLKGSSFEMLKFRSMTADAEAHHPHADGMEGGDDLRGNNVMFKLASDPRTTRLGRFLRRYSLDELPQLWNVLQGDMSLVGPRPALVHEVAKYDDSALRRLAVRPGMTGLWQVSGRSDLSWSDTVRLDLYYVDNWSITQDMWILVRTFRAVVSPKGAY